MQNTQYIPFLKIARDAIQTHLEKKSMPVHDVDPAINEPRGVFVTLWILQNNKKQLRGCIGHLIPVHRSLTEEVIECAIASATHDPRFPPLSQAELHLITIELSILQPLELVKSTSDLDPKKYGVVVTNGTKRGTLLPEVDGVDTASLQIAIAKQKAGIEDIEPVTMYRYEVSKASE